MFFDREVDAKGNPRLLSKILEINSKTGLYPLYVAYTLFRARKADFEHLGLIEDAARYSVEEEHAIWDDILMDNIYVVCNTEMAARITKRTLVGFRAVGDARLNVKWIELVEKATTNRDALIKDLKRPGFWHKGAKGGEMKFNAVVGNPPYQVKGKNKGDRDNPIYHLFYDTAFGLSDRVTLISPGRFLFNAGQTPKTWNEKMLSDEHVKVAHYWQKSTDLFPNVDIKGGVVIIWRDKHSTWHPIGTFTVFPELNSMLRRVWGDSVGNGKEPCESGLDTIISSRGHYRFSELFYKEHPKAVEAVGEGTGNMIASNAFLQLPKVFLERRKGNGNYAEVIGRIGNERVSRFILAKYIEENEYLSSWNVLVPEANGTGAIGEVLSTPMIGEPMIGEPMIGSTDTFISVGKFRTSREAQNCMKYVKTKFARAMLGILKATQHNPKSTWRFVPLQDFTSKSDIDWSRPVEEIDRQLYAKYRLTAGEVAFVESMIKPMA